MPNKFVHWIAWQDAEQEANAAFFDWWDNYLLLDGAGIGSMLATRLRQRRSHAVSLFAAGMLEMQTYAASQGSPEALV